MSSFVKGAFCPNCNGLLYLLSRDKPTDPWNHAGAPLRSDRDGRFVRCPACTQRVALAPVADAPGWGFEVDTLKTLNRRGGSQ